MTSDYLEARKRVKAWVKIGCPSVVGDTNARERMKRDLTAILNPPRPTVEEVARVISGAPFPSQRSLAKASQVTALFTTPEGTET